jgi:uncharacterized membrane protein YphA (DoxX/SURF4 family)
MDYVKRLWTWLWNPPLNAPTAVILIRITAGGVFLGEGILKFLYPSLGARRFLLLGFPLPDLTAGFIGGLEIIGGILLLAGFLTRAIAIPFAIEMIVASVSTKVTEFLGTSPLPPNPVPPVSGIWAVIHDVRSEYAQFLCCVFLLIVGPGLWSLDAILARRRHVRHHQVDTPAETPLIQQPLEKS